MPGLESFFQKDFSSGMVTNVNENLVPPNSVQLALNCDMDEEIGSATSRLGTGVVNTQLENNETILGVHDFQYTGAGKLLAAVNASGGGSSVVTDVEADSNIRTGLTADLKMRFLTFLDSVLMINGTDSIASYNGSTVITTGGAFDIGNIPASDVKYAEEFLDRVYLAGDANEIDRLYYSGVAGSGTVSWTSDSGNIDIEPESGSGGITALSKVPGYLLIFKERSMHRWNFDSAFPESLVNIGTPSQESVVKAAGLCAFFSASSKEARGFYITNGGRPVAISHDRPKNIKKWIDAIPVGSEANIAGVGTERFFMWSVGDVTVDGVAYTNVCVRWNRVLDQWSVRSYPSEFRNFTHFVDSSGNNVIVGGDDDGNVIEIDKASTYTDYPSTTEIVWQLKTQDEDFEFNQIKEVNERIVINSRGAEGARVEIVPDGGDPVSTGDILRDISELKLDSLLRGNRFSFLITGQQDGGRATIKEIEVPNINLIDAYE